MKPDKQINIADEFANILKQILEKEKFIVTESNNDNYDFDIKIHNKSGFCEVKFYQSRYSPTESITIAAQRLSNQNISEPCPLLLVANGLILDSFIDEIYNNYGVQVWDSRILFAIASNYPDLFSSLESILAKVYGFWVYNLIEESEEYRYKIIISEFLVKVKRKEKIDLKNYGENLFRKIKNIKYGKKDFRKYENACSDLLNYLFKNDLELWSKQESSEDGLNRYDLICRINNSTNNFWSNLYKDFNSRYVIFEFKNYKEKIKQNQIYTTEKYLYKTALRSISFIVSRNGADKNALKAAKGALKESGKLIVNICDNDLFEMAINKDRGDAPEMVLMRYIDELLIELNR